MPTKAELEDELAAAEKKAAKLEKKLEKAAESEPVKAEAPKASDPTLDDISAAVAVLMESAEDDAVLMSLVGAESALERARSAKRAHAHINEPPDRSE